MCVLPQRWHPARMSNLFLNFFSKRKCSAPAAAAAAAAPSNSEDDYFSSSDDYCVSSSDLAVVLASRRFFFSSPGRSNSILESSSPSSSSSSSDVVWEGVKVGKYSVDPYADFRRSMEEMVEAREMENVRSDWDYLQELLSCYLRLNPNHTHKFIITAFSDLLLSLLANSPAP